MHENWFKGSQTAQMRNQTIKEAFMQTQARLDKKSRIDSVFSGTTCC